jgi:hypothetical protein
MHRKNVNKNSLATGEEFVVEREKFLYKHIEAMFVKARWKFRLLWVIRDMEIVKLWWWWWSFLVWMSLKVFFETLSVEMVMIV